MPSPLNRLPVAAITVPTIYMLTSWRTNALRLPYEDALPTIGIVIGIAVAIAAALRPFVGSWRRASLMAAAWAAYLLYAPSLSGALFEAAWLRWALLAALALFTWDVARHVPRAPERLDKVNRLANLTLLPFALTFVAITAFQQVKLERGRPATAEAFAPLKGDATAQSHDVWHIVLDRYASSETLQRVYGFDNEPFLDALRARGFVVSEDAFSNYQRTGHSVTSTVNAAYLDGIAEDVSISADWVPLYRALTNNAALRFFEGEGYDTVFAGSWWNPTRRSRIADRNVNFRDLPELARLILWQSVPGRVLSAFGLPYGDDRTDQCLRVRHKFAELRRIAADPARKYVFGHFLVPHPPFVLNADGSCRPLDVAEKATRADNYAGQVTYANRELLALIDAIVAGPRPATIVIHADEGPWPEPFVGDERFIGRDPVAVDWANIGREKLREKMGILLAIRHPEGPPPAPLKSPINIYPHILNRHFGGRMELLPDRHHVFISDRELYRFADVSDVLK